MAEQVTRAEAVFAVMSAHLESLLKMISEMGMSADVVIVGAFDDAEDDSVSITAAVEHPDGVKKLLERAYEQVLSRPPDIEGEKTI